MKVKYEGTREELVALFREKADKARSIAVVNNALIKNNFYGEAGAWEAAAEILENWIEPQPDTEYRGRRIDRKISAITALRRVSGMSLSEAKNKCEETLNFDLSAGDYGRELAGLMLKEGI